MHVQVRVDVVECSLAVIGDNLVHTGIPNINNQYGYILQACTLQQTHADCSYGCQCVLFIG